MVSASTQTEILTIPFKIIELLTPFRPLFSRWAAFAWFVVVIAGFLLRVDHYGVSSFVRWLHLPASTYPLILHFFHASSWSLGEVMMTWMTFSQEHFSLVSCNGRLVALGDGIKVPKESHCQPGLKYLHSPSQNQNKPQTFVGHNFSCIAFVAQVKNHFRAILQVAQIHEGVDELRQLQNSELSDEKNETSISRMVSMASIISMHHCQPIYLVLDAFFSTSVVFNYVYYRIQEDGSPWMHVITKAKSSYVAYIEAKKSRKQSIKLWSIFDQIALFTEKVHPQHPERTIKYYCRDLYWGNTLYYIRFVWVIDGTKKFILMSSDTTLNPIDILRLYGLRFQIELSFRTLKHLIGGFCYRFWSSACKVIHEKNALVRTEKETFLMEKSLLKLTAIERYVNLAIIAHGLLSYFALVKTDWVWTMHKSTSWLRSYSSTIPSEEIVQRIFQSLYISSFSLQELKALVSPKCLLKPPKKRAKVRKNGTLEHFLSS